MKFVLFFVSILTAFRGAQPSFAQSVTVDPVALAKGVKQGLTQERRFHRVVFFMELAGAAISVGGDGGSTEYVNAHAKLWEPACACFVQVAHETDPLFLKQGTQNLSQVKLWVWKGALAGAPFGLSWASHRFFPESNAIDATLIGLTGVADFWYGKAAIDNLRIASQIKAENAVYGK